MVQQEISLDCAVSPSLAPATVRFYRLGLHPGGRVRRKASSQVFLPTWPCPLSPVLSESNDCSQRGAVLPG